jgi:predicted alpha/beta superfamily hydrolase
MFPCYDPSANTETTMRRTFLTLLAAAAAASITGAPAWAQSAPQPGYKPFVLNNTQIIPMHSASTGREHELVVVLPSSFGSNPGKTYPVLYFLDAYWDTPLLVSTYGNLMYDNRAPEFIMVGLSYPSGANYDVERRKDYTITAMDANSGRADAFLDFITKEVAPLVESRFRGEKRARAIAGSSLGGLFAIAAAYKAPGFFAGHIAISPAAGWDDGALAKLDERYARDHKALPARMFISYGTDEYPGFREPIAAFQQRLAARGYQGLALQNYAMHGLDHTSVKGDGYVRGLNWIWQPRKPAGPSGLTRAMTQAAP